MLVRPRLSPLRPGWLILGAILVLAAALRVHKIGAQSLWYDEGNSARIAERSLALIVAGAAGDIHPPLYYVLLKYWRAAFGEDEAALRSFSAACSALTVLFAYLIGRDAFGWRVGLIAAFLLAVVPFAIYYAQEARMYALLALCAAASTWAMMRTRRLLYIAATAAGLWTHYAYPFIMIAQGVAYLSLTLHAPPFKLRDTLGRHILLSLIAIALFLPWAPVAIRQVRGWGVERPAYALGAALLDAYRTLIVGRTLQPDQATLPVGLFTAAVILGATLGVQETPARRLAMLALASLPLALLFAFGLYREAYLKFLLVCVLPLCVLAARGIVEIGDWGVKTTILQSLLSPLIAALITLILAATFVPSLRNLYDNPAYARDDYRSIHQLVAARAHPDDAVTFLAPNQWEVFTYYQRDDRNLFPLTYRPASYEAAAAQMQAIASSHRRIFVLYFAERDADPEGWYELWMSGSLYKVHERWVGNIRLAIYDSGVDCDAWPVADGATFGQSIALVEARSRLGEVRQGDTVPVELTWQALAEPDRRYKVFTHIGLLDGAPIAQHDSEPVAGYRPTDGWSPTERIVDRRGAWIPLDAPPGVYGVFVGLYDPDTGARLSVTQNGAQVGDRLKIGEITIHRDG